MYYRKYGLVGVICAIIAVALLATPGLALADTVTNLPTPSGTSPFAGDCGGVQGGTLYMNAEVEPWVAVNPANSLNIVGGWQQDRWSNGGANSLLAGVSTDGGASWAPVTIPTITRCAGGNPTNGFDFERASDPWLTFAPNGHLYFFTLAVNFTSGANAVIVSKSTDGGSTWSPPVKLQEDTRATLFNDKNSITADPNDSNYVYAVWDRLESPQPQASAAAAENAFGYRGPTLLARTTDGGATWEPARAIFQPSAMNQTIGNQIVVLPASKDGVLVNAFDLIYNFKNAKKARGTNVAIIRSLDKGTTWSAPIFVSPLQSVGVRDPETGFPVRTGDIIPEVAVDSNSGALYMVWQDARFSGGLNDGIAFAKSTDGGLTWTAPVQINKATGAQAFTPAIAVASDGSIGVTYYDFRNNTADAGTLPTDYWFVRSSDGGTTWGETHVSGPFNMATAPVAGGYFLGDYEGLASAGTNSFIAFFGQTTGNSSNPTDILAARLTW